LEKTASEVPSSRASSIDPTNPEGDFLRCLQSGAWLQAKCKLLRLQEGAVQNGDMLNLLKYKYWEQCVSEKNQQPDFSYRATADWQAFNRVGQMLLDKPSEGMMNQAITQLVRNSFHTLEVETSALDANVVDEENYDFWDNIVEGH